MGKSSITTQLALSLSLAGHSVGILDVDLTGPSIPRLLGIESAKVKQAPGGWLPVELHASQILPALPPSTISSLPAADDSANGSPSSTGDVPSTNPNNNNVSDEITKVGSIQAMSLAFLLTNRSSAIVWRGPKKTAMVRQFLTSVLWPPTDYLLIDTPPGTSDEHISLVETLLKDVDNAPPPSVTANGSGTSSTTRSTPHLAGAVIVTTPQAVAVNDVRKELNFCRKTGVRVIGVVENMSGYVCECCGVSTNVFSKGGGEVMAREFGVPFLGGVPLDAQWGILVEEGKRPVYGGVVKDSNEEHDSEYGDAEAGGEAEDADQPELLPNAADEGIRDEGLLVDKYRNCSLSPVFKDITQKVVKTIETGTAVSVTGIT